MVRKQRTTDGQRCAQLLVAHQVPERFARKVGQTYDRRGPGAAMLELYAGGWEVKRLWIKGEEKLYVGRCLGMKGGNGGKEASEEGW